MSKTKIYVFLALALVAALTMGQASIASAQDNQPVGVVVAYMPGQSITIVDQSGVQHAYTISPSLKILPPGRADSIQIGSFVTIIAPASLGDGKQTAVGIVIHPHVPNGWNLPNGSITPVGTGTPVGTETVTATGTLLFTQTAASTASVTGTPLATGTETPAATPTAVGMFTDTPTPTPAGDSTTVTVPNSLINWLKSLLSQVLSNQ